MLFNLIPTYIDISAGKTVVDVKFLVLVIGISVLTVAVGMVLRRLNSMMERNMQVHGTTLETLKSGKAFAFRDEGIVKKDI